MPKGKKEEKKICHNCGKELKEGEAYIKEDSTYRHEKEPSDEEDRAVICEFC